MGKSLLESYIPNIRGILWMNTERRFLPMNQVNHEKNLLTYCFDWHILLGITNLIGNSEHFVIEVDN